MKPPACKSKTQLRLSIEDEAQYEPAEDLHEALVQVLAELLLEAMGSEATELEGKTGDGHEPEDHA